MTETQQFVTMGVWRCKRCGHQWTARQPQKPRACGKCKSAYWDRAPVAKKKRRRVLHK